MAKGREGKAKKNFTIPLGAHVLGVIVDVLNLREVSKEEVLRSRTAADYFRGERGVKESSRVEVHRAIVRALAATMFLFTVDDPAVRQQLQTRFADILGWVLARWDEAMAEVRSRPVNVEHGKVVMAIMLRLLVIDLSLRLGTAFLASGDGRPNSGPPSWAQRQGRSELLRRFLARAPQQLSRDALAKTLRVHAHTVDAWLHKEKPVAPSDENLQDIVEYVLEGDPDLSRDALLGELRRGYALCSLAARLAGALGGWETVTDLGEHLMRYAALVYDELVKAGPPPELLIELGSKGSLHPAAREICEALWRSEPSRTWQTDLQAAPKPWVLRLRVVMGDLHAAESPHATDIVLEKLERLRGGALSPEEKAEVRSIIPQLAALAPQIDTSMPLNEAALEKHPWVVEVTPPAPGIAANRLIQLRESLARGDFEQAIAHGRRAVQVQPQDAECHYRLGCALNIAGYFDEALQECWLASKLKPGWEWPLQEIGIIHCNRGDTANRKWFAQTGSTGAPEAPAMYRKAADHLTDKVLTLPTVSPLSRYHCACARMRVQEYERAVEEFEKVIADEPANAKALDFAAHSYFMLGNDKRGRELAKEAQRHGSGSSFERWKAGSYSKYREGKSS